MIDKSIVIIVTLIIMSILTLLLIIEIFKKIKRKASNNQYDVGYNNQETMYSDYSSAQYEPTPAPMPEAEPATYSSVANDTFTVPIVPGGTGGETTLPSTDELINQANAGTLNDLGTNNYDSSMDMNNLSTPGIDLNNGMSDLSNMPPVIDDGSMNNNVEMDNNQNNFMDSNPDPLSNDIPMDNSFDNNVDPLSNMPPVIDDGSMNNMNTDNNENTFGNPLEAPPIMDDSSNSLEENLELDKNNNLDLNLDNDVEMPDDGFY